MTLEEYYSYLASKDTAFELDLSMKAVSKQRPRTGKSGHFFTPKQTREFEKLITAYAKTVERGPFYCPVSVYITVLDPVPKSYKGMKRMAAESNYTTPPVGDLDNKVKAITDALNGIAYLDDRQIKTINASRFYGPEHHIHVLVSRAGLSQQELDNLEAGNVDNIGSDEVGEEGRSSVPLRGEQSSSDSKRAFRRYD